MYINFDYSLVGDFPLPNYIVADKNCKNFFVDLREVVAIEYPMLEHDNDFRYVNGTVTLKLHHGQILLSILHVIHPPDVEPEMKTVEEIKVYFRGCFKELFDKWVWCRAPRE